MEKMNLSVLPVCNSLLSKYASCITALLEIDYFWPVVHDCFTDGLLLISGYGLK